VRALERFYSMLSLDPDRAAYGYQFIKHADEHLAVDELLVSDQLFKSADVRTRKQYVQLVESVREHNGKVYIFSGMHVSGEQLGQYTGIAGTLRFPLVMPPTEEESAAAATAKASGDDEDDDDDHDYRIVPTRRPLGPSTIAKRLSQQDLDTKLPASIPEEAADLDERDRDDLCDDFIGEERRRRLSSADLSSLHFDMAMMGLG
jgi:hypothetical protein